MPIIMHFLTPVTKAPAPHMVSGEPADLMPLAQALQMRVGHQGQAFAPACDPNIITNETHRASGEPWALLTTVDGVPAIDPTACPKCLATAAWKAAIKENPHPRARPPAQPVEAGCC